MTYARMGCVITMAALILFGWVPPSMAVQIEKKNPDGTVTSYGLVTSMIVASGVTTNTTTTPVAGISGTKTFQWVLTGTGAVTQNVVLKGSFDSDGSNPTDLCTLTVSGTAPVVDACPPFTAPFPYLFVTTTVTTGTNASGTGKVGY